MSKHAHHDFRHWVLLAQSFAQVVSHSVVLDQLIVANLRLIHTDIACADIFVIQGRHSHTSSDLNHLAVGN
jgi:hypothetical protein